MANIVYSIICNLTVKPNTSINTQRACISVKYYNSSQVYTVHGNTTPQYCQNGKSVEEPFTL